MVKLSCATRGSKKHDTKSADTNAAQAQYLAIKVHEANCIPLTLGEVVLAALIPSALETGRHKARYLSNRSTKSGRKRSRTGSIPLDGESFLPGRSSPNLW